jgi:Nuclease-related domain
MSVTRRLAVITGLGREGTVDGALLGLRGAGWRVLRRPRLRTGHLDHVVLGPGGLFLILVRSGSGRLRPEWAQEAKAQAALLARLTGREATPLIVLNRAGGWTAGARPFHGVEVLPGAHLADQLVGRGRVLSPTATGALYAGLRLALAA